jgi:hypothetical protein
VRADGQVFLAEPRLGGAGRGGAAREAIPTYRHLHYALSATHQTPDLESRLRELQGSALSSRPRQSPRREAP